MMLPGRVRVLTVAVGEDHTHHWADDDDRGSTSSAGALLAADERRTTRTAHQMGPQRRYTRRSAGPSARVCAAVFMGRSLRIAVLPSVRPSLLCPVHITPPDTTIRSCLCRVWRGGVTCVVLKAPLNPNQPTNQPAWFETLLVFDKSFPP